MARWSRWPWTRGLLGGILVGVALIAGVLPAMAVPEVRIRIDGVEILDGGTFDLGTVNASATLSHSIVIDNVGTDDVSGSYQFLGEGVNVTPDPFAGGVIVNWTITQTQSITINSTNYTPSADGAFSSAINITNDDPNWTSYKITLSGTADGTAPTVTGVSVSDTLISDADAGNTFTVTVDFSEGMTTDGSADPAIVFSPAVPSTLSSTGGSWPDSDTYQATFTISDSGVDEDTVTIDVNDAKDASGNGQQDYTPVHEFEIDTENPTVTVTASDPVLSEPDLGVPFYIWYAFSEPLDPAQFNGIMNPNLTQASGSGSLPWVGMGWIDATTWEAEYELHDKNESESVAITAMNANDAAGNPLTTTVFQDLFLLDTQNPTVTSVSVSDTLISDADAGNTFTVTVVFSEGMTTDGSADPSLTFSPTVGTTLSSTGGSWADSDTYQATYTIADAGVAQSSITIDVTGAKDANGNDQADYTPVHEFEIDTVAPATPDAPDLSAGSDHGEFDDDDVTNDNTPTFSGSAGSVEGSSTVELFRGGTTSLGTVSAAADGSWSLTSAAIPDGSHDLTVTATDAAGNVSSPSSALPVLIDTTPPTTPTGLSPADGTYTNDGSPTLSWNAASDPGGSGLRSTRAYRYLVDGTPSRDGYTSNTSYTPSLAEGAFTWRVRARDVAGNNGSYASESDLYIDLTVPTDPTLGSTSHTVGVPSNDTTVDVTATGAADPTSNGVSSGVDGFDTAWDQSPTWTATEVLDVQETWTGDTFTATSDGAWYFHIATRDNAGNWTSTEHLGPFPIDTADPEVTELVVSDMWITDADTPGTATWVVTVQYSEAMNTGIAPTIDFAPGVASTLTLNAGQSGWINSTTYEAKYDVADNGVDEGSVTIDAAGAEDLAGNAQTNYTPVPEFGIDTDNPVASTVTVDSDPITEADLAQVVTVTFDETMLDDGTADPTIVFSAGTWVSSGDGAYSGADMIWTETFTLTDNEEEAIGVTIDVTGAEDALGNPQADYTPLPEFDLDVNKPSVSTVAVDTDPVYEGDLTQLVTVTFDEEMEDDGTADPAITFSAGSWTSIGNGTFNPAGTEWTETFTLTDNEEEVAGVTIDVTGTEDAVGNSQEDYTPEAEFDIDVNKPFVSNLTVDTDPMYEGDLTQVVTVTFDEAMGTGVDPTITFGTGTFASQGDGAWSVGDTVWTETFDLTDNDEEIAVVTVDVTGAQDAAGNPQENYTAVDEFDIDTVKPSVSTVDVDTDPVFEGDLTQIVTVTFDEVMLDDGTADPTITFSAGTWNSAGDGAYNGLDTVWTETFTVVDNDEEVDDVTIDVTGAKDAAGNDQEDYTPLPEFDLDTRKPIPGVYVDHTTIALAYGVPASNPIYEGSLTLTVTAVYDEDMNTATSPTISLVGETAARWTGPLGGTWGGTQDTYTATFVHDGIDDEAAGVYALVIAAGGATDVAGNDEEQDTSDPFDVDTRKPTIELIEVEENGYCGYGCYGSSLTLPLERREFDVTIDFSESVWQPGGDQLILTFDLDAADDPLVANNNTLVFSGIGPDATSATAVWAMQDEFRVNVVEDGDNSCDLAVTTIALSGDLYDVAGNAFVIPTHPLGQDHNVYQNQDIIVDTVPPSAEDDPEAIISYNYVQPRFLAFQEVIEGVNRIVLREDTEIYIDVLTNDPDNCEASKHLLGTDTWPTLPKYGTVSLFTSYPTPFPAAGCNATIARYIPPHDYTGPDDFTYRMRDCSDNQATARVDLYVFSRNIVENTYYTIYQGMPLSFALETRDDLLVRIADHAKFEYAFEILKGPANGVLVGNVNDVRYDNGVGLAYVNMTYVPTNGVGVRDAIEWAVTDPFTALQTAFVDIEVVPREGATTDTAPVVEIPIGDPVHLVPPEDFFDGIGLLGLRIEAIGILGEITSVIEAESILDVITLLGDPSGVQYLQIETEALGNGIFRMIVPFGGGEIVVPFEIKEAVE